MALTVDRLDQLKAECCEVARRADTTDADREDLWEIAGRAWSLLRRGALGLVETQGQR